MSRRTRDRQYKAPREKHTANQRCGRKKQLTEEAAKAAVWYWISRGAAPNTVHAYRCNGHWHAGHRRGSSWSR